MQCIQYSAEAIASSRVKTRDWWRQKQNLLQFTACSKYRTNLKALTWAWPHWFFVHHWTPVWALLPLQQLSDAITESRVRWISSTNIWCNIITSLLLYVQELSTISLQKYQRQSRRSSVWLRLLIHLVWLMVIWSIRLMSTEPYCGLVSSADCCPVPNAVSVCRLCDGTSHLLHRASELNISFVRLCSLVAVLSRLPLILP